MAMDIHGVAPLLRVFDMPTSLRFYRDVLGFAVGYGLCFQWPANQKWPDEWVKAYGIESRAMPAD